MKIASEILDSIIDELYCLKDNELMELAQKYLEYNLWEEKIGYMSDLDYECNNLSATEIIDKLDENFSLSDSYITVDECGYIKSWDVLEEAVDNLITFEALAIEIIKKGTCDIASIQEILDEMEEEEND